MSVEHGSFLKFIRSLYTIRCKAARVYLVHLQGCIAGDTDLEQSCAEVSRLLTARVLESDDASLNPKVRVFFLLKI